MYPQKQSVVPSRWRFLWASLVVVVALHAGCHWGHGGHRVPAGLESISVTPTNPSIAESTTIRLLATAIFRDRPTDDRTATVAWSSSDESVATVSSAAGSEGVVSTVAPGFVTISARWGSMIGSTTLTVSTATLVSIAVTPTNPTIA